MNLTSEEAGGANAGYSAKIVSGVIHTVALEQLSFTGPSELDALGGLPPSLQITSPADGTNVQLGQILNVTVAASGTFQAVTVLTTYPLRGVNGLTAPPYQFSITVPTSIPLGTYYLTALGVVGPGQGVDSPQISINVVGNGTPVLTAQPSTLNLRFVGDQAPLQITGQFPNGQTADVTQSPRTSYVSGSASVAAVSPVGMVTATGPGSTYIMVNNVLSVPVNVPPPVTVVPYVSSLYPGQNQQFTATLKTAALTGLVNWASTPAGTGTISNTGFYRAPAQITAQQVVTITATNAADNTQSASARVILYPYASTRVTPASVTLGPSQTQQFKATVSNVANGNMAVTWSVSPSGIGTVDGMGLYTAPASITSTQTITITAASVAHSYATDSATITLTPPQ